MNSVSYGVVAVSDHGVLLVQTPDGKYWGFPKGHREDGDATDQDAAVRELAEETGMRVDASALGECYNLEKKIVLDECFIARHIAEWRKRYEDDAARNPSRREHYLKLAASPRYATAGAYNRIVKFYLYRGDIPGDLAPQVGETADVRVVDFNTARVLMNGSDQLSILEAVIADLN